MAAVRPCNLYLGIWLQFHQLYFQTNPWFFVLYENIYCQRAEFQYLCCVFNPRVFLKIVVGEIIAKSPYEISLHHSLALVFCSWHISPPKQWQGSRKPARTAVFHHAYDGVRTNTHATYAPAHICLSPKLPKQCHSGVAALCQPCSFTGRDERAWLQMAHRHLGTMQVRAQSGYSIV